MARSKVLGSVSSRASQTVALRVSSALALRESSALALGALLALAACTLTACGGGGTTGDAGMASDAASPASIEIAGRYDDGFGTTHVIDADGWSMTFGDSTSLFEFTTIDDVEDFAIARNDPANMFSPGLYSRFEWVRVGGQFYFCQSTFDAPTEAAAIDAARPDRSDPAMTGCATFAWSPLTPVAP